MTHDDCVIASEMGNHDLNNHIDSEKIQKLNESLYQYYKDEKPIASTIIADIYTDLSVQYKDILTIDSTLNPIHVHQMMNTSRNFLQKRITYTPQLVGTAWALKKFRKGTIEIDIFSDMLYNHLKYNFDIMNIPTLENFDLTKEDLSQFSRIDDVKVGSHRIIADDEKIALHTKNICDCVAIVAQGINKNNIKMSFLAHYYRNNDANEIVKVLENSFDAKNIAISLITSWRTSHLLEMIKKLKNKNFIIKGCKIEYPNSYLLFHGDYNVTVWPLTGDRIPFSPMSVLVIPCNENVCFSNKSLRDRVCRLEYGI